MLAGEIRCKGVFEDGEWAPGALDEIEATVRSTVKDIGYEQAGFHWNQFRFENNLHGHVGAYRAGRSTKAPTRTKARATRGSCSAMRPTKPPT